MQKILDTFCGKEHRNSCASIKAKKLFYVETFYMVLEISLHIYEISLNLLQLIFFSAISDINEI